MTTFELLLALLITLIATLNMILLAFLGVVWKLLDDIKGWQKSIWQELRGIRVNVADTAEYTHNHIAPNIECIYNAIGADGCNNFKKLSELTDIVDKMHRNLCVEIAYKMVDRVYPPTYNIIHRYAPNGICINPQMDCINCPKRGTGGTWSTNTSIKAEDAPLQDLQEMFNDNK